MSTLWLQKEVLDSSVITVLQKCHFVRIDGRAIGELAEQLLDLTVLFSLQGLLDTLNKMNVQLEEIQKSLDMYLETKRQLFPRFYFLSNDDLLEILGQSKNPEAVSRLSGTCELFPCNRRKNVGLESASNINENIPNFIA